MTRVRCTCCRLLAACALLFAPHAGTVGLQLGDPATAPVVQILSPGDDAYVSGPTLLRARVDPPGAVARITFYADGRQVCELTKMPFECDWDAGPMIAEHQVRVAVTLVGGGRVVQTVRTKSVGYAE